MRMPPQLKRRVSAEATKRDVGMNDVVLGILAGRFDVPFTPSGRKGSAPGDSGVVLLRMAPELKQKLQAAALTRASSTNRVIVGTLADHLAVQLEPPRSQLIRRIAAPAKPARLQTASQATPQRKEPMASQNGSSNGKARRNGDKVRVAIVGVGNCANSLLQGVEYYKDADPEQFVPGLMHVDLGGYHISDIEFTAAFDVTADKVGKDL
ncbi:MAG: hypothetical protein ABI948_13235, partial [Thermoleophilia bacterium]